jgi:hypothetical protein
VSAPAFSTSGDTNTGIFFPAADTMAFTEGGVERMRITSAGDVGIGTSTPTTPDGTTVDNPLNGLVQTIYGPSPALNLIASSGSGWSLINFGRLGTTTNPYRAVIGYDQANDNLVLNSRTNLIFKVSNDNIDAATERLRITSAGNVGIGTTSPTSRLTVNGNIGASLVFTKNRLQFFRDDPSTDTGVFQVSGFTTLAGTVYRSGGVIIVTVHAGQRGSPGGNRQFATFAIRPSGVSTFNNVDIDRTFGTTDISCSLNSSGSNTIQFSVTFDRDGGSYIGVEIEAFSGQTNDQSVSFISGF